MEEVIQLVAAFTGSMGFAMLFNIKGKNILIAAIGGFISWAAYLIPACAVANPYFCGFVATVVTTLYAEIMSRVEKTPVTVFLVSATIPLIPGASLYRAMNCLMQKNYGGFWQQGTYTLLFAASMAAGMTFTTILFRTIWKQLHKGKSVHIR